MDRILVFPRHYFQRLLAVLARVPRSPIFCEIGINQQNDYVQYLVRGKEFGKSNEKPTGRFIAISTTTEEPSLAEWLTYAPDSKATGYIMMGRTHLEGKWWGAIIEDTGDIAPISKILLVGHEMLQLDMSEFAPNSPVALQPIDKETFNQWSRTIGGLSQRVWLRLTSLSLAIIGCGRSGASAAVTLLKSGVRKIVLIDPDEVENQNLPEMDGVTEKDIGHFKVDALASFLGTFCISGNLPQLEISVYRESIVNAHRNALQADVLICCVDNDAARLACGMLATLYHKVLLDISTGILPEDHGKNAKVSILDRQMGADVRMIVPGHGCLSCFGTLVHYEQALKELARLHSPIREQWWVNRSGSLRTLNMTAVHLGLQMLYDFIAGRIERSRWLRLEYGNRGEIILEQHEYQNDQNSCSLCRKAGMGDQGLCW